MDPRNAEQAKQPEEPRFLNFKHQSAGTQRDGKPVLNRWSSTLTNGHDFPGAQVNNSLMDLDSKADATWAKGHALRSWCSEQRSDENATPRRHCKRVVGR
jgi:hypothetical protein